MNEHDLYLKWDTGSMVIHMDEFFPCSKKDFIFLVKKVINLDYHWETYSATVEKLKVYFQERIKRLPEEVKEKQQKAAEYEKKMLEAKTALRAAIKAEKAAAKKNGVAPDWRSYERLEDQYEGYKELVREAKADARKLANSKPKFEEYLEILESERQRW